MWLPLVAETCSRGQWCPCTQHLECKCSVCVATVQVAQLQLAERRQMERAPRLEGQQLHRRHAGEQLSGWSQAMSSSHPRAVNMQVKSSPAVQGASVGHR